MIMFLRSKLDQEVVKFYMARWLNREMVMREKADKWRNKCERCKFMMGISDEELDEYLAQRRKTGEKLRDRQLTGCWKTLEDEPQLYEFRNNHTFSQQVVKKYPSAIYAGVLVIKHNVKGRWEIKGDTLYRYYDKGRMIELDESGITYSEDMKEKVEQYLGELRKRYDKDKPEYREWTHEDIVRHVAIDRNGNKIELTWQEEDGISMNSYFVREK
jgi:hypothetical protein